MAIYSDEVVRKLGREHEIDVFVDEPVAAAYKTGAPAATDGLPPVRSAHDFVWRHQREPYDLTVFQLGNSSAHDYAWPYLFRYPGLAVLHDVHLHHARASALLRLRRSDDYRAEFVANHPDLGVDLAELAVAGFDNHLYYTWPMTRLVALGSRLTAVHSPLMAEALRDETSSRVETIRMAHGRRVGEDEAADASRRVRTRHNIPDGAVLFGVLGGLTPEKRVPQVISAFAGLLPYAPHARLLLAGEPVPYCDLQPAIEQSGLGDRVVLTGRVADDERFTEYIAACDVSINLRWPTAREVSGPWIRALGAGRPTITTDLAHSADVPGLDPRTWTLIDAPQVHGAMREPVTVTIDIVDEDHSLRLAMRRLAVDPELRARLGGAAAAYWERDHSMDRMLEDYRRAIEGARAAPRPTADLPSHLRANAGDRLDELLEPFGLGADVWSNI